MTTVRLDDDVDAAVRARRDDGESVTAAANRLLRGATVDRPTVRASVSGPSMRRGTRR